VHELGKGSNSDNWLLLHREDEADTISSFSPFFISSDVFPISSFLPSLTQIKSDRHPIVRMRIRVAVMLLPLPAFLIERSTQLDGYRGRAVRLFLPRDLESIGWPI
jgi:hypothetical protein